MITLDHPLVEAYLQDVANALRSAEPERRHDILEQLADHIATAVAPITDGDDAAIQRVLDRLGPPADIAAAADVPPYGLPSPAPATPVPTSRSTERWALVAFALSPVLCLVGWIVGVVLLWTSQVWTTRHKVVGTVATLPFALAIVLTGFAATTSARSTETVAVSGSVVGSGTPASSIVEQSTGATPTTDPDASTTIDAAGPTVTTGTGTQTWSVGRVLTITGWALLLVVAPVATLVWLGRAARRPSDTAIT